MANSETSFGDRLARGRSMQGKIADFQPPFAPEDTSLTAVNFDTFLDLVEARNGAVATAKAADDAATTTHKMLFDTIKTRTLRVVDTVSGNVGWAAYLPKIEAAARQVRNTRARKKPAPPPPGATPKPSPKTGQQSYGDVDLAFNSLIEATRLVPSYMPSAGSNVGITQLETLLGDYRAANKSVAATEAALSVAQTGRYTIYNGETGSLRAKMKAVKKAAGGQYGRSSGHYAAVKGIQL